MGKDLSDDGHLLSLELTGLVGVHQQLLRIAIICPGDVDCKGQGNVAGLCGSEQTSLSALHEVGHAVHPRRSAAKFGGYLWV